MTRHEDWPARLDAAIEEARKLPFKWGEHDCLLFASSVVERLTGIDRAAQWRGTYDDAIGAYRKLHEAGGMVEAVSARLGLSVSPLLAKRGDVVSTHTREGQALGICVGARCAFVSPDGMVFLRIEECTHAWHV